MCLTGGIGAGGVAGCLGGRSRKYNAGGFSGGRGRGSCVTFIGTGRGFGRFSMTVRFVAEKSPNPRPVPIKVTHEPLPRPPEKPPALYLRERPP
ncbi:unnamed protein product, partial [Rotaria sp. Silwood1]